MFVRNGRSALQTRNLTKNSWRILILAIFKVYLLLMMMALTAIIILRKLVIRHIEFAGILRSVHQVKISKKQKKKKITLSLTGGQYRYLFADLGLIKPHDNY